MSYMNSDHLRFYIENFNDLKLTERLINQCKDELPKRVAQFLFKESLRELRSLLSEIEYCELNEPDVWWSGSQIYDYKKETGLYFGIEGLAEGLGTSNSSLDGPYFFLYSDQPNSRKGRTIDIRNLSALIQNLSATTETQILAGSGHLKDDGYLALMPAGNIISIATLFDPKSLAITVRESAQYFTSELLQLVKESGK